jgi:hypothetical protein
MGIEWFSCILSVVFLLPVLLFYLFWGRDPDIGHVFRFPPDILFPFSQKPKVLAGKPVVQFFKERFAG